LIVWQKNCSRADLEQVIDLVLLFVMFGSLILWVRIGTVLASASLRIWLVDIRFGDSYEFGSGLEIT
jgi:hypothetical protein